jgi:cardiolipin synthase
MTLPSWITVGRLVLVPVILVLLWLYGESLAQGRPAETLRWTALGFFLLAAVTDALDGILARRLQQETRLGKALDPLADKLLILAMLLALSHVGPPSASLVPRWFAYLMASRDLFLLLGGLFLHAKFQRFQAQPHWTGKVATFLTVFIICGGFLRLERLEGLCAVAASFALFSLGVYCRYGIRSWIRASYLEPCASREHRNQKKAQGFPQ